MKTTLVTGLWDIKRDQLGEGWSRSFDFYLEKFSQLLDTPDNMIIYGESQLSEFVFKRRTKKNTIFIERSVDWFKNEFFTKIQEVRKNPKWLEQAGWLKDSTQAKLEMYNPLVLSKMFLLNDARIFDTFNSTHLFWIDAGITNTVHPGYFTSDNVTGKLSKIVNDFSFVAFPYKANNEIHGFSYPYINSLCDNDVKLVCRGGFFGGSVESISNANSIYYNLLSSTLNTGHMGTEESIFSIMLYKYPESFGYFKINSDGLLSTFFENLKNDKLEYKRTRSIPVKSTLIKDVGIYVLTYNAPEQFKKLCESFKLYDTSILKLPKKFLINNSLDRSTDKEYSRLCKKYGFEEIKKDNIGICGGRQFAAEHFEESTNLEYYLFFEDDMFFYSGKDRTCKNGFTRKVDRILRKSIRICDTENLDFLKLNFTEFFGDNRFQWSWHNVPGNVKRELFKDNLDKMPPTNFKCIKSYDKLAYALGDIFYCNWPQVVSREGNKKMFLDTKWTYPYEQTWMSHIYQLTLKSKIKPGILLATPTEHDRFEHYEGRKEN
tara:strand:+ start:10760 stop:12397 length:1638 start_codon:yes stop_codon:yes gene_type:complete